MLRMFNDRYVRIVAAVAKNNVIGADGRLPWSPSLYPEDLQHFARITSAPGANTVIMGRRTWESLPYRPLRRRDNIVVSSTDIEDVLTRPTLEEALKASETDTWVIGGAKLYNEALKSDYLDELIISEIYAEHKGDTYFPDIPDDYIEMDRISKVGFDIVRYSRS